MHKKNFYICGAKCKLFRMSGFRAYCGFSDFGGGENVGAGDIVRLDAAESRHLCGALRAREGDSADVFDLRGNVFACSIIGASQKSAALEARERIFPPEPSPKIFVAQCLPKSAAFDEIIRQSVELGASGIFPLVSGRTVVRIDPAEAGKKARKWEDKCIEAVKQSANLSKFEMSAPVRFSDFLPLSGRFDAKIVASLRKNARPVLGVMESELPSGAERVCVLIGPEGDLTDAEYDEAERAGFLPVSLGENVMKCDTAAMCALSVTKAFFGRK